ncbi:MAG: hypothetical protein MSIBF_03470 [Candidatus Altiarchaeales archaeon IMC4]|nr:MAG: hypothetical protein MSIBF_03470 [Candidatus Altiarchaeales archaeon IMC4]
MYLDKILGTRTKINAIYILLKDPARAYIEKELAKEADTSVSEINRQLPDLVAAGLVSIERVGKTKRYQINARHFLYPPLRDLFKDLNDVYMEIADKITEYIIQEHPNAIQAVLLTGSVLGKGARSDLVHGPSDIDLLFVVNEKAGVIKNHLLEYINHSIVPEYGIVCYPLVLTSDEYMEYLKGNKFIIGIHANAKVLYGKKPRGFGKLVPD